MKRKMESRNHKSKWDHNLPDVNHWIPRADSAQNLRNAFFIRCQNVEERIQIRAMHERNLNIDNFDSGVGTEDIIREELESMLPKRYSIRAGVIDDSFGNTAGDFEIIIFNDIWFPAIKAGATAGSRRYHYPIEGVYAVLEVKQTIDYAILDKAMEKLVICHRLHRPPTEATRIVENRKLDDCPHSTTNPLYSAIIALDLRPGIVMDDLVNRFFAISQMLKRKEVIRALCVLGQGTVLWGVRTDNEVKPALFMHDLDKPIIPVYDRVISTDSVFFTFVSNLLLHLYHSVLGAEDIAAFYGKSDGIMGIPKDPNLRLDPDP